MSNHYFSIALIFKYISGIQASQKNKQFQQFSSQKWQGLLMKKKPQIILQHSFLYVTTRGGLDIRKKKINNKTVMQAAKAI